MTSQGLKGFSKETAGGLVVHNGMQACASKRGSPPSWNIHEAPASRNRLRRAAKRRLLLPALATPTGRAVKIQPASIFMQRRAEARHGPRGGGVPLGTREEEELAGARREEGRPH